MSKYHARKITRDGETFDSQKEYKRWCELKLLERAGKIRNLRRQVKYVVIPVQAEAVPRYSEKTGKRLKDGFIIHERECAYFADFVYEQDGELIVEDTKGVRTPEYVVKRKLMLYVHGIKIKET